MNNQPNSINSQDFAKSMRGVGILSMADVSDTTQLRERLSSCESAAIESVRASLANSECHWNRAVVNAKPSVNRSPAERAATDAYRAELASLDHWHRMVFATMPVTDAS